MSSATTHAWPRPLRGAQRRQPGLLVSLFPRKKWGKKQLSTLVTLPRHVQALRGLTGRAALGHLRPWSSAPAELPGPGAAWRSPRRGDVAGASGGHAPPSPFFSLFVGPVCAQQLLGVGGDALDNPPWGGGKFPRGGSGTVPGGPARSPRSGHGGSREGRKIRGTFLGATKKAAGMALTAAEPTPPALPAPSR